MNDEKEYCLERLEELLAQVKPNESFIKKALQVNIDKLRVVLKKGEGEEENASKEP